jgi:hypothetical protein
VSNLLIASITCRKITIPDYKNNNNEAPQIRTVNLKRSQNNSIFQTSWKLSDPCYVNLKNILPTRVATLGLTRIREPNSNKHRYLPIFCNNGVNPMNSNIKDIYFQSENIIIDYLALIDVTPENIDENESIVIETIHNMNNFEKLYL